MVTEQALAKINLTLHVTGQREDGYHLLDSLVVFAGVGDELRATPARASSLRIEGPFGAEIPRDMDNLVLRAAQAFGRAPFAFELIKNLPPASGIGGGSADAAAAIRATLRLASADAADLVLTTLAQDRAKLAALGADVPVCLLSHPARMRGVGEVLDPLCVPPCWAVLANPRVEVPTPAVFRALANKANPAMPEVLPAWPDAKAFAAWLATQRNDLETPARSIAPVIGTVLAALAGCEGALLVRMSGSGATCFALFDAEGPARAAAAMVQKAQAGWWVAAAPIYAGRKDMSQLWSAARQ
jgi:4-diphosphocytidyl-2-C-methyl-D-erythritol kinase